MLSPEESFVITLMRECAEECSDFAARFSTKLDYEYYVQLAKACSLRCCHFAQEWETNSSTKLEALQSSIFACDLCAHEFSQTDDVTFKKYVVSFQSCAEKGKLLLNV